jgi:hypothetical protein
MLYEIKLTPDMLKLAFGILSKEPYRDVAGLLALIQTQANAQDEARAKEAAEQAAKAEKDAAELAAFRQRDVEGAQDFEMLRQTREAA